MQSSKPSGVLITGVTGLLGGEILLELMKRGDHDVAALVRANETQSAAQRFQHRVERSGGPPEYAHRAIVIEGDIVLPQWGLSMAAVRFLSERIRTIIHCAADTSFIRDDSVCDTNIQGTKNLIALAKSLPDPPRIVYVSTATNVGCVQHCSLREEDGCKAGNEHYNAYTQSKAVAESMLGDSGLDVLVVRPTIVLSAGVDDRLFARNILWFAPLLYEFESLPIDPAAEIDLVSSAYVAHGTVELMMTESPAYDCYHISAGRRFAITIAESLEAMTRHYHRKPPVLVPPDEWTAAEYRRFVRTPEQRKVFYALRYYLPFLNMDVTYDNTRFYQTLGQRVPRFDTFESYSDQLLGQIGLSEAVAEAARP